MDAWRHARPILAALGFSRNISAAITGEVRRRCWSMGALEPDDLLAVGIAAAWQTLQDRPDARGGLIRLRVRWAVQEAVREESFAHGERRPHRRRDAPAKADRRCRCGKSLGALAMGCVRLCVTCQFRAGAESSRRYRERKQQAA
jgi:hypothetical protein